MNIKNYIPNPVLSLFIRFMFFSVIFLFSTVTVSCSSDASQTTSTVPISYESTSVSETTPETKDSSITTVTETSITESTTGVKWVEPSENINPLTGKADMDPDNYNKRSVAIVVNNHYAAIPQRGLHRADVIYEYETESGQTRLLALFADISAVPEIGPIRSARILSADLCAGTNSIFIHFGSNWRVPDHLKQYGIQAVDGNVMCASSGHSVDGKITLSKNLFFYRDDKWRKERAIEHSAVTNGELIRGAIDFKSISTEGETPFLFPFVTSESPSLEGGLPCTDLTVYFSATNCDSNFKYDKDVMMYTKYQYGGKAQIDEITGEMIFVKNVIILFADIRSHGDPTIDAFLENGGTGYYASDGKIIEITWEKPTPTSSIELFDKDGNPVMVNAGRSYINVVRQTRESKTQWE